MCLVLLAHGVFWVLIIVVYDFGASVNGGHDNVSWLVGKGADFKTMIFRWGSDGHGHVACKSFCAWNSRPTVSTNQFKIHSENILK